MGNFDLEIMQPLGQALLGVPLGTTSGMVGQDQGAIARFLEKRGVGLLNVDWHIFTFEILVQLATEKDGCSDIPRFHLLQELLRISERQTIMCRDQNCIGRVLPSKLGGFVRIDVDAGPHQFDAERFQRYRWLDAAPFQQS